MSFLQFLVKEQISKLEIEVQEVTQIISLLQELPKTCFKQIIAPVNSVCMQQVKLIHTNELLVKLGDYYIEQSAIQAKEIQERKILNLKEKINKLKKQLNQLEQNQEQDNIEVNNKEQDNFFEIVETLEESEERAQMAAQSLPPPQKQDSKGDQLMLNGIPFEQTETYKIFQQFNAGGKEKEYVNQNSSSQIEQKQEQIEQFKKIGEKVNFEMPSVFSTDKEEQLAKLDKQNKKISKFKQERIKQKQQLQQQ